MTILNFITAFFILLFFLLFHKYNRILKAQGIFFSDFFIKPLLSLKLLIPTVILGQDESFPVPVRGHGEYVSWVQNVEPNIAESCLRVCHPDRNYQQLHPKSNSRDSTTCPPELLVRLLGPDKVGWRQFFQCAIT